MAYNDSYLEENWKNDADKSISAINRLMVLGKKDLIHRIIERHSDELEWLIDEAIKMKSLLLKAEEKMSNAKENNNYKAETKMMINKLDDIEDNILDMDKWLRKSLDEMKKGVGEVLTTTNAITDNEEVPLMPHRHSNNTDKWTPLKSRQCNLMIFRHDLMTCTEELPYDHSCEVSDVLRYLGVNMKSEEYHVTVIKNGGSDGKAILKVEFDSPTPVCIAMSNARRLKSFNFKVFVANDLNYLERVRLRKCVQELKERQKQQPETYWAIRKMEVVSLGQRRYEEESDRSDSVSDEEIGIVEIPKRRYEYCEIIEMNRTEARK